MATQNHIRVIDDLTNRIRWAAGTLDTLMEDENLDPPVIDAISSAKHHMDEVRQLVSGLPRGNGFALDALDLTFDLEGKEYTLLGALGKLSDSTPEDDPRRPIIVAATSALLDKARAEHDAEKSEARVFADADGNGANARLLIPGYRLAHEAPDWSDDVCVYDMLALPLHRAEKMLDACDDGAENFDPTIVYAAHNELRDLHAILDAWIGHRQDAARQAAQRAIDRGDDPETVADIEADTREVLDLDPESAKRAEETSERWNALHSIGQLAEAIFDDSDGTDFSQGTAYAIMQLAERELDRHAS